MTEVAFLRHLVFCAGLALVSAMVVAGMISARIMDMPEARKAHTRPTPKGGGVGVVVAFMLGISVLYGYAEFARLADGYFRGLIIASLAIAVVSLLDDLYDFPFAVKLATQALAGLSAVATGLYVQVLHVPVLGAVDLGWAGAVATLAWILFATNAMNFMDGLNGLAAGLAGFLPFNFPRARIFLGDVGSQFCGFVLAVLGVAAARFDAVTLSFLLVPCLLNGVLFDVAFTLARRTLSGQWITRPHRSHLYQVAQRSGMDARLVAVLHWGFAGLGGLVCLGIEHSGAQGRALLPLLLLPPQLVWLFYVVRLSRRAGLGRW